MPPRDPMVVVMMPDDTDRCQDQGQDCYKPTTPQEEHDEWVSSMLYRLRVEAFYMAFLIRKVKSLCKEYMLILDRCHPRWSPRDMDTMRKSIRIEKEKMSSGL